MEDSFHWIVIVLVQIGIFASSAGFGAETREVVLLGSVKPGLRVVVVREAAFQESYRRFSASGVRAGRDRWDDLRVEIWGPTYLLGVCRSVRADQTSVVSKKSLLLQMQCSSVKKPHIVQAAWLEWGKKERGGRGLKLRSGWTGQQEVRVEVDYDGIHPS